MPQTQSYSHYFGIVNKGPEGTTWKLLVEVLEFSLVFPVMENLASFEISFYSHIIYTTASDLYDRSSTVLWSIGIKLTYYCHGLCQLAYTF